MTSTVMSDLPPQARICVLKKAYPEQEYGFDLHAEKLRGQFVGNVDEESPAGLSGLKRGDRILAVNGHPVSQQNHKEVVRKIQDHPLECKFVVIDEAGYLWYTSRKMSVPVTSFLHLSNDQDLQSKPVKSVIISEDKVSVHSDGLMDAPKSDQPDSTITVQPLATSLSLDTDVGLNDQKVDFGSDEIAKVTDVEYLTDESSVFVEDPVVISLDREITSEKAFGEENIPMMDMESVEQKFDGSHVDERDTENIEHSKIEELPRLCKLYRSAESQEYGFNLHAEKNKGHFIGKIDADSPADLAGLVEGYRIVGVNNTLVYVKTPHKEVVALIKQNPMNTNLLIVSPQLDAIHTAEQKPFSFQHAEIVDGSRKKFAASSVDGIPLFNADKTEISNGRFHLDNQVETLKLDEQNLDECADSFADAPIQIPSVDLNKERVEILPVRESNGHVILNEEKPRHAAPYKISAHDIFQLSASEMRERLSRNKKVDPRKESISIREKYEIIQNL